LYYKTDTLNDIKFRYAAHKNIPYRSILCEKIPCEYDCLPTLIVTKSDIEMVFRLNLVKFKNKTQMKLAKKIYKRHRNTAVEGLNNQDILIFLILFIIRSCVFIYKYLLFKYN
jgi:hypothetical protein